MAGIRNQVKKTFLKALESIGTSASNMATNAHHQLNEINLETRRRELITEVPNCVLELWQKGVELPEPLSAMMKELSEVDEQLTVLRAQRYARVEAAEKPAEPAAGESETPAPEEAGEAASLPADGEPVTDESVADEAEGVEAEPESYGAESALEADEAAYDDVEADTADSDDDAGLASDDEDAEEASDFPEDDEAEEQPAEGEAPRNFTPVVEQPIDESETGDNA